VYRPDRLFVLLPMRADRRMFDAAYPQGMAATSTSESTPQRLAAIRAQMSLLSDYL
jgi:hypothetical protein